jgi:hypothetical protein
MPQRLTFSTKRDYLDVLARLIQLLRQEGLDDERATLDVERRRLAGVGEAEDSDSCATVSSGEMDGLR